MTGTMCLSVRQNDRDSVSVCLLDIMTGTMCLSVRQNDRDSVSVCLLNRMIGTVSVSIRLDRMTGCACMSSNYACLHVVCY